MTDRSDLERKDMSIDALWLECLVEGKILSEYIDAIVSESEIKETVVFDKALHLDIRLPNGFVISGRSAVVDPKKYDRELGYPIALRRAVDTLWLVEGYRLQTELGAMR